MNRPDRWFDTSGRHPYERSAQEVHETTQPGEEGTRYTQVVYENTPIGFVIHVSGRGSHEWVLEELRDSLLRELGEGEESQLARAKRIAKGFVGENILNGATAAVAGVSFRKDNVDHWWAEVYGPRLTVLGLIASLQATTENSKVEPAGNAG